MPQALLSVSDKAGLEPFARGLIEAGFTLLSTGGTLRALQAAGLAAVAVSEVTGFPEILDGRVKTLHPAVHAGILARPTAGHRAELARHGIAAIDLVAVNLYPFRAAVARGAALPEAVEHIDIGGPAMLRAAAKNHERVWPVVDPGDYQRVLAALARDEAGLRRELAAKAFAHTAAYDAAVAAYLGDQLEAAGAENGGEGLPERLTLRLERSEILRYGENPHQAGARYRLVGEPGWWDALEQHKGAGLSYLNLFDADAGWRLAFEFDEPACVIVKHANPCGVALAPTALEAYLRAFDADPKSAFGGVVALNRPVDAATAEAIMERAKADVLLAPGYGGDALELLGAKRKAMRVLSAPPPERPRLEVRRMAGGFLVQEGDRVLRRRSSWSVATGAVPDEGLWRDLELAWTVCAYASSNAVVLAAGGVALGVGAGQQSRVDAALLAVGKAASRARGGACASDAFFPFRDGIDAVAESGVAAVIQPGGSVRDDEVIAAAAEHGMSMVLTARRHFRH